MNTLSEALAMGQHFTWGPIVKHHSLGRFDFIEHKARVYENNCGTNRFKGTEFSLYIDGKSISRGAKTIESAMATVLAYAYDGPNTQADRLFLKMIGCKEGA